MFVLSRRALSSVVSELMKQCDTIRIFNSLHIFQDYSVRFHLQDEHRPSVVNIGITMKLQVLLLCNEHLMLVNHHSDRLQSSLVPRP